MSRTLCHAVARAWRSSACPLQFQGSSFVCNKTISCLYNVPVTTSLIFQSALTNLFSLLNSCSLLEIAALTSSNCSLARVSSSPADAAACSPAWARAWQREIKSYDCTAAAWMLNQRRNKNHRLSQYMSHSHHSARNIFPRTDWPGILDFHRPPEVRFSLD